MRNGHTAQVEIVGFLIFGASSGIQETCGSIQDWKQSQANLVGETILQSDQILLSGVEVALPEEPVAGDIHGFEGDHQLVCLLHVVSGDKGAYM